MALRAGVLTLREVTLIDATRLRGLPLIDAATLLTSATGPRRKARRGGELELAAFWAAASRAA